jgi:BlaI family penicillinase repressor
MKVLWSRAPLTASEVITELNQCGEAAHPKTIKTFLNRLVGKGALGFEKSGRNYLYSPLVSEADCVAAASESFLERVFGGSLKPMLAHFVGRRRLSRTELAELKKLLEEPEP